MAAWRVEDDVAPDDGGGAGREVRAVAAGGAASAPVEPYADDRSADDAADEDPGPNVRAGARRPLTN